MKKGKQVPITDQDVKNLKAIKEAAKTFTAMAEWTGFSKSTLSNWFRADEYEVTWYTSSKKKIARIARELNPEPLPMSNIQVPVFKGDNSLSQQALDLAISLRGKDGELEALRLAVDLLR